MLRGWLNNHAPGAVDRVELKLLELVRWQAGGERHEPDADSVLARVQLPDAAQGETRGLTDAALRISEGLSEGSLNTALIEVVHEVKAALHTPRHMSNLVMKWHCASTLCDFSAHQRRLQLQACACEWRPQDRSELCHGIALLPAASFRSDWQANWK